LSQPATEIEIEDGNLQHSNTSAQRRQDMIEWRQSKVIEYMSKGFNNTEIAAKLQVHKATIGRDIRHVMEHVYSQREDWGKQVFEENQRMLFGLTELLKKLWEIIDEKDTDSKERLQAISLLMQCYDKRLEAITNKPSIKLFRQEVEWLFQQKDKTTERELEVERREEALSRAQAAYGGKS
jgi:IS30 family transposase